MLITGDGPRESQREESVCEGLGWSLLALAVAALRRSESPRAVTMTTTGGGGGGEGESLDLVIGNIFPQTGALASFAPAFEKGAARARRDQRRDRGDRRRPHGRGADRGRRRPTRRRESRPPASSPARERRCFNGAAASSSTIAITESVSTREGILQISPASTSPDITDLEDEASCSGRRPRTPSRATLLADIIDEGIGGAEGKTVNIGARNDAYGPASPSVHRGLGGQGRRGRRDRRLRRRPAELQLGGRIRSSRATRTRS